MVRCTRSAASLCYALYTLILLGGPRPESTEGLACESGYGKYGVKELNVRSVCWVTGGHSAIRLQDGRVQTTYWCLSRGITVDAEESE